MDLINYCLRIVFNHYDRPFDLDYKKEFFDRYSQLSIDKLITSTTVEELVDNLKDTEYYAVSYTHLDVYKRQVWNVLSAEKSV